MVDDPQFLPSTSQVSSPNEVIASSGQDESRQHEEETSSGTKGLAIYIDLGARDVTVAMVVLQKDEAVYR